MSIPKLSGRDQTMLGMMSKDFNENGLSWDEIKEKASKKGSTRRSSRRSKASFSKLTKCASSNSKRIEGLCTLFSFFSPSRNLQCVL